MSIWRINNVDVTALNATGIKITRPSLDRGMLSFTCAGLPVNGAAPFANDAAITLTRNGVTWWRGVVVRHKPAGSPDGENHEYTCADPWYWLEHTSYLQNWIVNGGVATVFKSRVVLGIGVTAGHVGEPMTQGQSVAAILAYAQSLGLQVGAGAIDLPGYFKVVELNGVSCAEAIRSILKWQPDAVSWWDHSGPVSKLNIKRRASLVAVSFPLTDKRIASPYGFTARTDLVPNGVRICYEVVSKINSQSASTAVVDVAGQARGLKVLDFTVQMHGSHRRFLKERIVTRTIEMGLSGEGAFRTERYWGAHLGITGIAKKEPTASPPTPKITFNKLASGDFFDIALAHATETDGTEDPLFEADDSTLQRDWAAKNPNIAYNSTTAKNARKIALDKNLNQELLEGRVQPWMSGVKAQRWVITANITFTKLDGTVIGPVDVYIHVVATNANTREYTELEEVTAGETIPAGVAALMYGSLAVPQYEGELELTEEECTGALAMGNALNVTGGAAEWAHMNATIQQITEDIVAGKTRAICGPPAHLAPGDFIELMRAQRAMIGDSQASFERVREQQQGWP